jgi:hypothetical protein
MSFFSLSRFEEPVTCDVTGEIFWCTMDPGVLVSFRALDIRFFGVQRRKRCTREIRCYVCDRILALAENSVEAICDECLSGYETYDPRIIRLKDITAEIIIAQAA